MPKTKAPQAMLDVKAITKNNNAAIKLYNKEKKARAKNGDFDEAARLDALTGALAVINEVIEISTNEDGSVPVKDVAKEVKARMRDEKRNARSNKKEGYLREAASGEDVLCHLETFVKDIESGRWALPIK